MKPYYEQFLESYNDVVQAIEYLEGWEEGDNITITADFVNAVETIAKFIK